LHFALQPGSAYRPVERDPANSGQIRIFNQLVDIPRPPTLIFAMAASLDTVFSALADPTRRAILAMLLEDDMAVTDVAEPFEMSLAAISKHLTVLTGAGLISQERRGRVKWCKLEPDALREASVWMQGFGMMNGLDLDAFERFLDAELADPSLLEEKE
jgi:DNA-binding transcriptional ArsR family regulator